MTFLFAFLLSPAFAARDSVAVFLRPEKSVILINERGADSRLQNLFSALGAGTDLLWESEDQSIRLNCGRNQTAATCTIRLLPSANVSIEAKKVSAFAELRGVRAWKETELTWESSRANVFTVKIFNGRIGLFGRKP
jgi:hypothetical protein